MKITVWLTAVVLFLSGVFAASAQAPAIVNYQGRLINGTNLYNGTVTIILQLFSNAVPTVGEASLYQKTNLSVRVVDGLYSAVLGGETNADNLLNALTRPAVYVQVSVSGQVFSPRERIVSSGYALMAGGLGRTTVVNRAQAALHLGANGMYGQVVNFLPDHGNEGLFMECAIPDSESAGVFMNGNTLVMWSAGDNDMFRFYDQDELSDPGVVPKMRLDPDGNLYITGTLFEGPTKASGKVRAKPARDAVTNLQRRIAELEARLAALEKTAAGATPNSPSP